MSSGTPAPAFAKIWITAVRPFAYPASVLSVVLGLALARYAGYPTRWGVLLLTLCGVVCFHTAANLLNDCFDFRRGLDTEVQPTSGALVRGWLTERQVLRAAAGFLAIGVICGLLLVWQTGWIVLALGIAGAGIVLAYTRSGFCLKYAGLGDLGIFLAFGLLPVFGTFWVQAREFRWLPVFWSLPLVSLTVAILHANNRRDFEGDRTKGCRTPAGLLGERGSALYYRALVLGPYLLVALLVMLSLLPGGAVFLCPLTVLIVLPSLPLALRLARTRRETAPELFAMLDARTAQTQIVFGTLLAAAFFIAPYLPGEGRLL